jgi:HK97 family phage portal protein
MLSLQTLGLTDGTVGPSGSTMPSGVPIYNAAGAFGPGSAVIPPVTITPWSALDIPAFRRAVELLSSTLASFPRSVVKDGAKLDAAHPLDGLLKRRPNECQTAADLWSAWFLHAVFSGNGYLRVDRRGGFWPTALYNLLPEDVAPFRVRHADGVVRQWYVHVPSRPLPNQSRTEILPAADVLHLKGLTHDGMTGVDPVALHAPTFQRASTLDRFQTKYMQQGTFLRGVVKFKKFLTPKQVGEAKEAVRQFKVGTDGQFDDVLILHDEADFQNVTLSPQQSQSHEQQAALTKAFAQITGVPPELLYELNEAKYRPTEQEGQNLVRYTLRPWLVRAEAEMTDKLLTDQEQAGGLTVKMNPDALLRGDTDAVNKSAADTVNAGLRTKNEGRDLLGLPRLDDPEADKLKTLGDTNPSGAAAPASSPTTASAKPADPAGVFAALAPLIASLADRVEAKTVKILAAHAARTDQERVPKLNADAEIQGRYAAASFRPVAEAMAKLGGDPAALDVDTLADRYAAAVRRRAATGEGPTLRELLPTG